jgi:hypothetical protein
MEKLRIVVGGYIGLFPTGGVAWDYLQYPLGLKLMGHDVYYIEDTLSYPSYQKNSLAWDDASDCIQYLKVLMESYGFENRWAYRDIASNKSYGLSEEKIKEICASADVFINISCSTFLREEYMKIPKRILIDSDPMFTQIQYQLELAGDNDSKVWSTKSMIENHTHLFSFGENIHSSECLIPRLSVSWLTTRQPICLDLWNNHNPVYGSSYTSIMNWSVRKRLIYDDIEWGQKDIEFDKFKSIPNLLTKIKFEVIVNKGLDNHGTFNKDELESLSWKLLDPDTVSNAEEYRAFIFQSKAEFSVAKETYVKAKTGWFSCRSACYLAAGKPVITQETGWSKYVPSGEGLFAFDSIASAREALEQVDKNYKYHSARALEIAQEYFDSNKVLNQMLEQIN